MKVRLFLVMSIVLFLVVGVHSQQLEEDAQLQAWNEFLGSIEWVSAGGTGLMGDQGEIFVPSGYVFTAADGTQSLMEAFGNLLTEKELGFVAPERSGSPDFDWFAVFEFDEVGYVSDEEKEDLDADAMMDSMLENQKAANEQRAKMGYDKLEIIGWEQEPRYNDRTNNLEWAIRLHGSTGPEIVNLNTRLLGREGVMKVTLVCDPDQLRATTPVYQEMLRDFHFQDGRSYAEFTSGDKLAKYGLTGLVVGGGAAVLAKTGLLKKIFKPLLIALIAFGAWIKRFFTGKKSE